MTSRETRRGWTAFGCLVTLVLLGVALYFGAGVGKTYWKFYQFQDAMRQEVKFAAKSSNDQILINMRAHADSLQLPDDASKINIRRGEQGISIESEYTETLRLPLYTRDVHFHPHAEGPI
ncbi:MAG: hypothetical protein ABI442_01520 [Gemmatimonadaceae bacterium]